MKRISIMLLVLTVVSIVSILPACKTGEKEETTAITETQTEKQEQTTTVESRTEEPESTTDVETRTEGTEPMELHDYTGIPVEGIRFGMSEEDVIRLYGEPDEKSENDGVLQLNYSEGIGSPLIDVSNEKASRTTFWFSPLEYPDSETGWELCTVNVTVVSTVSDVEEVLLDFYGAWEDEEVSYPQVFGKEDVVPDSKKYHFSGWCFRDLGTEIFEAAAEAQKTALEKTGNGFIPISEDSELLSVGLITIITDEASDNYGVSVTLNGLNQLYLDRK